MRKTCSVGRSVKEMKVIIELDVPEWQIGQQVEVFFPDTMMKKGVCTLPKEQESLLGIQQAADSITFISTGTAKQGEERGIVLGQARMHEWLEKELLYRGLLTDAIRAVFRDARKLVK